MRKLTTIGLALTAIIALTAVATGLANAAAPEFRPSTNRTRFTSFAGPGKLQINGGRGGTIECRKETDVGEITGPRTVLVTIDLLECTALGFRMKSLGDPAGTVLLTVKGELCFINQRELDVGLLLEPTAPVHLEVATVGTLIVVEGSVVGLISPINSLVLEYRLLFKEATGQQSPRGCEGKIEELLTRTNEGNPEPTQLVNHTIIGFLRETVEIIG